MKNPDERFDHLRALARQGDECAIHDLYAEYGYDARTEPRAELPTTEESQSKNKTQENENGST